MRPTFMFIFWAELRGWLVSTSCFSVMLNLSHNFFFLIQCLMTNTLSLHARTHALTLFFTNSVLVSVSSLFT